MILVDSSVWIGFIRDQRSIPGATERFSRFLTCGPVLQEVFQGLGPSSASDQLRNKMLALPRLSDPLPGALFLVAAHLYQEGRRRGFTIRSSFDCLIAAIALQHDVPVWHNDRDFETIARYTTLRATSRYPA